MTPIILGRLLMSVACLAIALVMIKSILFPEGPMDRYMERYEPDPPLIRSIRDRWARLRFWYALGYYLSVKSTPRTPEEVNVASTWSLIHGAILGLILVLVMSWISGD